MFIRRPVQPVRPGAVYYKSPKQLPALLAGAGADLGGRQARLALEDGELTHAEYVSLAGLLDPAEIALLREGARMHDRVHECIPGLYRAGMTDWMFSVEIEHQIRLSGFRATWGAT